ncbi:hypothetical protein MAUB1S_06073 [Mycolicibacterium aubagnense]
MTNVMRAEDGRQDGFSLIELMVVLAIIALMAVIAVPALSRRSNEPDLHHLSKELAARLRVAHTLAIATGKPQRIDFNPQTRIIRFLDGDRRILPAGTRMTLTTGLETTTSEQGATLTFLPNGSSSGMAIDLELTGKKSRVEVNWLTGTTSLVEVP